MVVSSALIDAFRARAEAAQSVVHELGTWDEVAALALELAGADGVAVTQSLAVARPELLSALGGQAVLPDGEAPFPSVADVAVGIAAGVLAVAESGSVLLNYGNLVDRAVSMFARAVIQVVARESVTASLADAASWLETSEARASLTTLVTGPSRTADIERSLTIGVQGPSDVHVVLLG